MDKVIVEIFVPAIGKTYDVFIPLRSPMHEVLELLKKAVSELSDGQFRPNENTAICNRKNGTIINVNMSVYELGIQNGTKLMLI